MEYSTSRTSTIPRKWNRISQRWRDKLEKLANIADCEVLKFGSFVIGNNDEFLIGIGNNGTEVFLGLRDDGTEVAVKKMTKRNLPALKNEQTLLSLPKLDDPTIVQYVAFAEDDNFCYLALELCEYTLEEYIKECNPSEMEKKQLAHQVLKGLSILHKTNPQILHRDIKPQNVLIDIHGKAKLADFGISRELVEGKSSRYTSPAGTPCWMAKETLVKRGQRSVPYKISTDIQVAGMLIYYILSGGYHPFGDDFMSQPNIARGIYNLDDVQDVVAKHLIEWMIDADPERRPTVEECLDHSFWLKERSSGLSMKSDRSKGEPLNFSDEPGPSRTKIQSMAETHSESLPTEDDNSKQKLHMMDVKSQGEEKSCGPMFPLTSRRGSIDGDGSKNKDKSQPKAVDAGSSEIGEDDIKSSDNSSTVPDPGSIDEDSNKNKDEVVKGDTYVKNSQEINPEDQYQTEFDKLLFRLNLKENYENKLSNADFLKISPSIKKAHEITERDVAHAFLHKLLMLDHRARYIPVIIESTEEVQLKDIPDSRMAATEDILFDILCKADVYSDQRMKQSHVHPMDVQMAVFHCSDSFLRQNMITKLSQCQYALPLLVPDPVTRDIQCPLWTFRQIRKSWKVTDKSGAITCRNMPICQTETPMVSFFRLGSVSSSKSQLMNSLINDRHSTFFHRDCPGATKSHCLIDGMAEIAWYLPAGKPNDAFPDCVAFCNLHGDALSHKKQCDILIDKASVNVVLLPTLGRGDKSMTMVSDLFKGPKPLICLLAENDSVAKQIQPGKYTIGVKDRGQSDVAEELKGIIRNILSTSNTSFQLERLGNASGIKTDEDDHECRTGRSAAEKIVELLDRTELSKIKDTFLPCHGHLWQEWCRVNKEKYRLSGHIEKEKSEKETKMSQIRKKQRDKPPSDLKQMFIENLKSPNFNLNHQLYFLKWIGFFLDNVFTDKLSEINQAYDAKWSEVLALKKKKEQDTSQRLMKKQNELKDISDKLQSATVGLEHILREIGQIYEANECIGKRGNWSQYPKLAAELMIAGQPMELMDGDAAHVPLTWITSVLDEVIKTLGDKRVYVLSVLGIQSSGKSTMLNAMFGLQFAVSAGRCTRGAFMQLVKVSEEFRNDFKFDYVLVVDTEGLRAPELAGQNTYHHDNELATFVIGLGNMTLINILGENPSEMQDVLHIAVQAFMRMKRVNLSPSCVFVHQNVAAIEAGDKNKEGKRRLQEKLDDMTKLAAKEEEFDAEFFSDVIAFDVETDVKYISQLWEGNPPMAPPNPSYSENIQELKNLILSKAKDSNGMTLSEFNSTVKDLWNALLNENFVFGFKNTQEISLYRKLEEEYTKWTWALRQDMLTIENQLHNRIENEKLHEIKYSDLIKEMNKTWEEVEKAVKYYFDEDNSEDVLVQWKSRFETKIKDFRDEEVRGAKRKLEEIIQQRSARKKMDDKKTVYENELLLKSKEFASKLKDKARDETELEKEFNTLWKSWVTELTAGVCPFAEINIQRDVDNILVYEMRFEWPLIQERKDCCLYKDMSKRGNYSDYMAVKGKELNTAEVVTKAIMGALGFSSTTTELNYGDLIRTLIAKVEIQTNASIEKKPVKTEGYHTCYMHEVANHVNKLVKEFEKEIESKKMAYTLKKEFKVDLLLNACTIAKDCLQKSHNEFQKNNDARRYLENQKGQFYNVFSSFCKGNSSAPVLGELLCSKLKEAAIQPVYDKTAIDLAGVMKCSYPPFSGNRVNLEKHVLRSLAEEEDFASYVNYITHPRKQAELFIKKSVETYISTNQNKVLGIMKKNVEDIVHLLNEAVYDATEKVKTLRGDTSMWLKEFSDQLKDDLRVVTNCYDHVNDIDDFDFLKEEIEKHLKSMKADVKSLLTIQEDVRLKIGTILIDQLCNCCWEQCPFCSAICTNTIKDHSPEDHSAPFHRPKAVSGGYYRGTKILFTDFCTTLVASDLQFFPKHDSEETIPYKEYRRKYADWRITPDESKLTYWKWFVCHFQKQLEAHYGKRFEGWGEIPKAWKKHTKQEAIDSLEHMSKLGV